jgi:hypothetical protein
LSGSPGSGSTGSIRPHGCRRGRCPSQTGRPPAERAQWGRWQTAGDSVESLKDRAPRLRGVGGRLRYRRSPRRSECGRLRGSDSRLQRWCWSGAEELRRGHSRRPSPAPRSTKRVGRPQARRSPERLPAAEGYKSLQSSIRCAAMAKSLAMGLLGQRQRRAGPAHVRTSA